MKCGGGDIDTGNGDPWVALAEPNAKTRDDVSSLMLRGAGAF